MNQPVKTDYAQDLLVAFHKDTTLPFLLCRQDKVRAAGKE